MDVNVYRSGEKLVEFFEGGYCLNELDGGVVQFELVVFLKGDVEFDDLQIWNRVFILNEIGEKFLCIRGNMMFF